MHYGSAQRTKKYVDKKLISSDPERGIENPTSRSALEYFITHCHQFLRKNSKFFFWALVG